MKNKDLTIVIPVRIDSEDRLRNLKTTVANLRSLDVAEIIVLEADAQSRIDKLHGARMVFIEDTNPLFYHTKYINVLCAFVNTEFIGVWDSDIIVPQKQFDLAIDLLRNYKADMVFPYDGHCYNLEGNLLDNYLINQDDCILCNSTKEMRCIYGGHTCGGAFLVNRKAYINAGGDNEKFIGWGPEDLERFKRWEIKGFRVTQIEGGIFHMHHYRGDNSRYYDLSLKRLTIGALLETCRMKNEYFDIYIPIYIGVGSPFEEICATDIFKKHHEFYPIFLYNDNNIIPGQWNTIITAVKKAKENRDDYAIICDKGYSFSDDYSFRYLISHISAASEQKADLLLGDMCYFNNAVPVGYSRYWVDKFQGGRFIVIYQNAYNKILEYTFNLNDVVEEVLSRILKNKMVMYPFIGRDNTDILPDAINKLKQMDQIYKFYYFIQL